jgi:hypothetical protein
MMRAILFLRFSSSLWSFQLPKYIMFLTSPQGFFQNEPLRGSPGVKEAVQQADEIVISPVVLGELKAGFFPLLPCSMD